MTTESAPGSPVRQCHVFQMMDAGPEVFCVPGSVSASIAELHCVSSNNGQGARTRYLSNGSSAPAARHQQVDQAFYVWPGSHVIL